MRFATGERFACGLVLACMLFGGTSFAADSGDRRDFEGFWRAKMGDGPPPGPPPGALPNAGLPPAARPGAGAPPNPAETLPYNAAGQQVMAKRRELVQQGKQIANEHLTCRPNGLAMLTSSIASYIAQTPQKLVLIAQEDRDIRQIFMDQAHPKKLVPSYMGHSVGRWEGDTLVVDTIGYNGRGTFSMLGGGMPMTNSPISERLHTVERWTKGTDGNTITIMLQIEDPVYYSKPFTQTYVLQRLSQRARLLDYDCAENPREDDFAAWTFEDDWLKPICIRPVSKGIASEKVVCTSAAKATEK